MTGRLFLTNKNAWTHSIENSDFKATGITMHAFIADPKTIVVDLGEKRTCKSKQKL